MLAFEDLELTGKRLLGDLRIGMDTKLRAEED
jgi:hypothetical protein